MMQFLARRMCYRDLLGGVKAVKQSCIREAGGRVNGVKGEIGKIKRLYRIFRRIVKSK